MTHAVVKMQLEMESTNEESFFFSFFLYSYSLCSAAIRGRLSRSLRSGPFVTGGHFSDRLWSDSGGNRFHDPALVVIQFVELGDKYRLECCRFTPLLQNLVIILVKR